MIVRCTYAGRSVIIAYAKSVRSTLHFTASIDAFAQTFPQLEAYFRIGTIFVVITLSLQKAPFYLVVRISHITRRTQTSTFLATRFRSTPHRFAQVPATTSLASEPVRTEKLVVAPAALCVLANSGLDFRAHGKRISNVAFLATTIVTSYRIDASCVLTTNIAGTFIYVFATDIRISSETDRTDAFDCSVTVSTFSVRSTRRYVACFPLD